MKTKITLFISLIITALFFACSDGDEGSGCSKVKNVSFSADPTVAYIQFEGEANSYKIEYGPTGFTQGSGTTLTTSEYYFAVPGLIPATTYDFYITSICSDTDSSAAYKLSSVTTDQSQCTGNTEATIYQTSVDDVDVEYYYSGGAQAYEVQYGLQGFTLGTGTTISTNSGTSASLTGLAAQTTYDFYVRAMCSQGDWSAYKKYTYTTISSCPAPANLNSWHISGSCNSGTETRGFSWSYPFGNPANYEFSMITEVGAPASSGDITVTSNTSIAFSGMYCIWEGFYVRANCGGGVYSEWAGPFYW